MCTLLLEGIVEAECVGDAEGVPYLPDQAGEEGGFV